MRPINLIPPEERRSHGTMTRTGPLAYIIVGALAVALIGVVMLVLTANSISDRQQEVKTLEGERTAAVSEVEKFAPYASFQEVAESRTQTIAALADSRFDWSRVIRQLSLVLPSDVYLTNLTASAGGGSSETSTGGLLGPSLNLGGCAVNQDTVAALVASLKEIDGVTRVGLTHSSLTQGENGDSAATEYCARGGVANFEAIVAFDGAPPGPDGAAAAAEAVVETPEAGTEESSSEGESEESSEGNEPESNSTASSSSAGEPAG